MSHLSLIIKNLQSTSMSLADLQNLTQVSLPTLRKSVQELTENHWIRVVGQAEANGGRPAMLFGLNEHYYVMVGVHLQLPGMRMILSDFRGQVLDEIEVHQGASLTPEEALQAIVDYVLDVQARFTERKLLGIGIATPGFTDPGSGDIISIGRVDGWQNFPICRRLSMLLDMPVEIANDVDCMAFAEFQHTGKPLDKNLTYFGFDEGVKVSIFLKGELYKGSFGNAGLLLSRLLAVPDADISSQDIQRILTISGFNELFENEIKALHKQEHSNYADLLALNHRVRLGMVMRGDHDNLSVCDKLANMLNAVLSVAITNILYVIQPDIIVLGGLLSAMPPSKFARLDSAIRQKMPPLFANHIQIEQAKLTSPNRAALGATYHFLEEFLVSDASGL